MCSCVWTQQILSHTHTHLLHAAKTDCSPAPHRLLARSKPWEEDQRALETTHILRDQPRGTRPFCAPVAVWCSASSESQSVAACCLNLFSQMWRDAHGVKELATCCVCIPRSYPKCATKKCPKIKYLFCENLGRFLNASDYTLDRRFEFDEWNDDFWVACRNQCGLIAHVGDVCAGEARRQRCHALGNLYINTCRAYLSIIDIHICKYINTCATYMHTYEQKYVRKYMYTHLTRIDKYTHIYIHSHVYTLWRIQIFP